MLKTKKLKSTGETVLTEPIEHGEPLGLPFDTPQGRVRICKNQYHVMAQWYLEREEGGKWWPLVWGRSRGIQGSPYLPEYTGALTIVGKMRRGEW